MRSALLIPLFAVLAGCMTGDGLQEKLRDASSAYNRALRWGDIDRAAEFLPATSKTAFLEQYDAVDEKLVIVEYDLTRLDLDREHGIAASRAQISWHTERELIVKSTVVDQLWQFHEGGFVLVDERRKAGEPLMIFAEVEETPHPYLPGLEAYRIEHEIGKENKKGAKGKKKRRRKSQRHDRGPTGLAVQ